MGLTSGVGCVGASSATIAGLEPPLRTRMLTLIFVFASDFLRFWRDLGPILGGQHGRKNRIFSKTSILRKSLFSLRKIAIFQVSGLENSMKNRGRKYACF